MSKRSVLSQGYIDRLRPFYEGNPAYDHVRPPAPAPRTEDDARRHARKGDVWVRNGDTDKSTSDVFVLDVRGPDGWLALSAKAGPGRRVAFAPTADDRFVGCIEFSRDADRF